MLASGARRGRGTMGAMKEFERLSAFESSLKRFEHPRYLRALTAMAYVLAEHYVPLFSPAVSGLCAETLEEVRKTCLQEFEPQRLRDIRRRWRAYSRKPGPEDATFGSSNFITTLTGLVDETLFPRARYHTANYVTNAIYVPSESELRAAQAMPYQILDIPAFEQHPLAERILCRLERVLEASATERDPRRLSVPQAH